MFPILGDSLIPLIAFCLSPLWSFLFLDFKDYTRKNKKVSTYFQPRGLLRPPQCHFWGHVHHFMGTPLGFVQIPGEWVFCICHHRTWARSLLWTSRNRFKVWKPLGIYSLSTLCFLIKCVATWLSHKSWPASELTLKNVCCYQNTEELPEVNVPCKVQIFQSLGQIICPWVASQLQTSGIAVPDTAAPRHIWNLSLSGVGSHWPAGNSQPS